MAIMDSISATKAKIEELKRIVEEHKARKDQCAAIISQQDIGNLLSSSWPSTLFIYV